MRMIFKAFQATIFAFSIGNTFCDLIATPGKVSGLSMQPTLNPDVMKPDFIIINKIRKYNVSKGDIVVLLSPSNPKEKIVKRVIALEGETISPFRYKAKQVTVPKGHIWVEGDSAVTSKDSNSFGPVALGLIVGKVPYIVWPPNRIQRL